jgi:hypothetical protein
VCLGFMRRLRQKCGWVNRDVMRPFAGEQCIDKIGLYDMQKRLRWR